MVPHLVEHRLRRQQAMRLWRRLLTQKLPERAAELGEYTVKKLESKLAGNPFVKEIRGIGLLIGIECTQPAGEIISEIHKRGVLVIPAGPNVIRLVPVNYTARRFGSSVRCGVRCPLPEGIDDQQRLTEVYSREVGLHE